MVKNVAPLQNKITLKSAITLVRTGEYTYKAFRKDVPIDWMKEVEYK